LSLLAYPFSFNQKITLAVNEPTAKGRELEQRRGIAPPLPRHIFMPPVDGRILSGIFIRK